jgi:hypothetical protein
MTDAIVVEFEVRVDSQQTIVSRNIEVVAGLIATWTVDWFGLGCNQWTEVGLKVAQ